LAAGLRPHLLGELKRSLIPPSRSKGIEAHVGGWERGGEGEGERMGGEGNGEGMGREGKGRDAKGSTI